MPSEDLNEGEKGVKVPKVIAVVVAVGEPYKGKEHQVLRVIVSLPDEPHMTYQLLVFDADIPKVEKKFKEGDTISLFNVTRKEEAFMFSSASVLTVNNNV